MVFIGSFLVISPKKGEIMFWSEEKHPRSNDGRFTFKNNGEMAKSILFEKSNIQKEIETTKQKRKNELLDILKDKATPTDVLLGDEKSLSKKIEELGLNNNSKNQYMTPIEEQHKRNKGYSEIWEGDDNFKKAMVRMFDREGNYSNDKNDLGGETKLGITIGTLNDYKRKHPDFKNVDIKKITKDQASKIYYDEYWKKSGADKIKDKDLAYVHFDATVNHGLGNSRKFLKESGGNFDKYIEIRKKYYNDIVKNKPNQKGFIGGWMNRLDEIEKNRGNLL